MTAIPELLTATELSERTPYSRSYIQAVKKAGFMFSHGRRTMIQPFLDWLAAHPNFRVTQVYGPGANPKGNR